MEEEVWWCGVLGQEGRTAGRAGKTRKMTQGNRLQRPAPVMACLIIRKRYIYGLVSATKIGYKENHLYKLTRMREGFCYAVTRMDGPMKLHSRCKFILTGRLSIFLFVIRPSLRTHRKRTGGFILKNKSFLPCCPRLSAPGRLYPRSSPHVEMKDPSYSSR